MSYEDDNRDLDLIDDEKEEENKMNRFYEIFRQIFEAELARKTGWGRNEIMMVFDKSFALATIRYAEELGISLI